MPTGFFSSSILFQFCFRLALSLSFLFSLFFFFHFSASELGVFRALNQINVYKLHWWMDSMKMTTVSTNDSDWEKSSSNTHESRIRARLLLLYRERRQNERERERRDDSILGTSKSAKEGPGRPCMSGTRATMITFDRRHSIVDYNQFNCSLADWLCIRAWLRIGIPAPRSRLRLHCLFINEEEKK